MSAHLLAAFFLVVLEIQSCIKLFHVSGRLSSASSVERRRFQRSRDTLPKNMELRISSINRT